MKTFPRLIALLALLLPGASLFAAPGAHGPNGEHLDGPAGGAAVATDGRPRLESFTELFELVAHLDHDAVTAMVNDYATNAPVDGAVIELEAGGTTVEGRFDPATGIYRFADQAMADALNVPGKHSLAFTITAGDDFDIVAGGMDVADQQHAHADGGLPWWWIAAAALAALVAVFFLRRRRRAGARFAGANA